MNPLEPLLPDQPYHVVLPTRLTDGILVQRIALDGRNGIAANVPLLQHFSETGFEFGTEGDGAYDLALACTHAILQRMDYIGPVQKLNDGNRVYCLALELHQSFHEQFIREAAGDELRIRWSKALSWMRRSLMALLRQRGITQATLLASLQHTHDALPDPLPRTELDQAELNQQLRDAFAEMTGEASMLSQFLGMIG